MQMDDGGAHGLGHRSFVRFAFFFFWSFRHEFASSVRAYVCGAPDDGGFGFFFCRSGPNVIIIRCVVARAERKYPGGVGGDGDNTHYISAFVPGGRATGICQVM